jgi:hypothetical protein
MRLVLALSPSAIEFTEKGSAGPHPHLLKVGALHQAARAGTAIGIAGTESASVPVTLDNSRGRVTAIARRPLRVDAALYDGEVLFFSGKISAVTLGSVVEWEIDA